MPSGQLTVDRLAHVSWDTQHGHMVLMGGFLSNNTAEIIDIGDQGVGYNNVAEGFGLEYPLE